MLHADRYYDATVESASWIESSRGTPGLQLLMETTEGEIAEHTLWVTDASWPQTERTLVEVFGADKERLRDSSYLERSLCDMLAGREVSIKTKEETWEGTRRVKVHYVSKRRLSGESGPAAAAARMFGSVGGASPAPAARPEDDDILF